MQSTIRTTRSRKRERKGCSLTREEERVDVLAVVAEGHLLLAEADSVLASSDTVEALEVGLVNAAQREVEVDRVWLGSAEGQRARSPRERKGGAAHGCRHSEGELPGWAQRAGSATRVRATSFVRRERGAEWVGWRGRAGAATANGLARRVWLGEERATRQRQSDRTDQGHSKRSAGRGREAEEPRARLARCSFDPPSFAPPRARARPQLDASNRLLSLILPTLDRSTDTVTRVRRCLLTRSRPILRPSPARRTMSPALEPLSSRSRPADSCPPEPPVTAPQRLRLRSGSPLPREGTPCTRGRLSRP